MPHAGSTAFVRFLVSLGFAHLLLLCLVTATAKAQTARINVALAANGAQATASSEYSGLYPAASVNNGDRRGLNWGNGGGWNCATANAYPDWLQIEFNGDKTIDEIDVFTLQDTSAAPSEPTEAMTFTLYGITELQVQYWNGVNWTTVPNGNVTNNDRIWRRFSFSAVTTTKIRVLVSAALFYHSRIVEVEAWSDAVLSAPANNVALAANGGIASASSTFSTAYPVAAINNGDRAGLNWGNGGGWNCATADAYPDWVQVEFNGSKTIEEIDVFTLQDGIGNPTYPTGEMTFTLYGITRFDVQYWDGSSWINVPNGSVINNNKVWRRFNFSPITTSKIKVLVHDALFHNSRIVEVEAWATPPASASARLDPRNRTGMPGEDPLSRNFNWSLPLVSLPGRAGMDLGLTLSYNSLVWTKTGSLISFDDDHGFPSPGFRLGFPVIQSLYYNQEVGKDAYLLIGSDGSRTELRQLGTSGLFESADSAHLLLDTTLMLPAPDNGKFVLRTTDGTRMWYELIGSDYQCTQIKDRNGNFITINYLNAKIDTITDTLNRQIKFEYDVNGQLEKITQVWKQGTPNQRTQTWASFVYTDIPFQTAFTTDLTVVGPANGSTRKLLSKVTLADNSPTPSNNSGFEFTYTSWGQIWKVSNFAADSRLLNYRSYNLPQTNSPEQPDCPRFTERRDWAENWNRSGIPATGYMLPTGPEQEVLTTFAAPNINENDSWTMPDGTFATGTRTQVTIDDGTTDKVTNEIYFIGQKGSQTSGWRRGLPALVRTYDSNGALQRQVMTTWRQDNEAVSYPLNPRVEETNTYDPANNRKRVRIAYETIDLGNGMTCKLPQDIFEYQANPSTVLRRTHTRYHTDAAYKTRRILGLPIEKTLYEVKPDLTEKLMSKLEFSYDGSAIEGAADPAATQQDNTNFGVSFVMGRGNLTSVRRYDVDDPENTTKSTTTTYKYNRAGSLVSSKDALDHEITLNYTDAFATNADPLDAPRPFTTLAYPTKVDDADGYSRKFRYNYDFGARTWQQTPLPNVTTNTPGPVQTFTYDVIGRLTRTTSVTNNAFTRYVYGPNYVETFSSINSIVETANEGHRLTVFDGLGRTIAMVSDHPDSAGGFSAQLILYDRMGRVQKQSNPTETSVSITGSPINPTQFEPLGDDALPNGGWNYVQQTYDWKGRPLVTRNQDGTTKTAEYTGCGCAGGEVVTLTDEGTMVAGVPKRRQQKIYSDVLGRVVKTEVFNWQGGTPYSTTVNTYNARDQLEQIRQFAGLEGSGTYQDTTMAYDSYGRLKTRHIPEQLPGVSTTWNYNADDTIQKITDGRGATSTFSYSGNNRKLVSTVTYALSGSPTISSSFDYDAAGNRTSMADTVGNVEYQYDQLSQLKAEIRSFTGVTNPSASDGKFKLSYDYNLAGALKKLTDASNMSIVYGHDTAGRINSVTGADNLYASVAQYATSFSYRAWGALKNFTDGTNHLISRNYNARLQTSQFSISGNLVTQNFEYFDDGRMKFLDNLPDGNFDRSYSYDHSGRLVAAASGGAARLDGGAVPYNQSFGYDAFSNLNARSTGTWNQFSSSETATYVNNRRNGWEYDNDGRNTGIEERNYQFNAAGQSVRLEAPMWISALDAYITKVMDSTYDGDGQKVKEVTWDYFSYDPVVTRHYLRSSMLQGAIIEEIDAAGQKEVGYVYAGNSVLAKQFNNQVSWKHTSPAGTSQYNSVVFGGYARVEVDPFGADVTLSPTAPPENPPGPGEVSEGRFGGIMDSRFADIFDTDGCVVDGAAQSCTVAAAMVNFGTGRSGGLLSTTFTLASFVQSLPLQLASPSQLTITFNVSGTEGRTTYETVWSDYLNQWVPHTPTAYSGTSAMVISAALAPALVRTPQTVRRLTQAEIDKIRSDMIATLENPGCTEFIVTTLNQVAEDTGIPLFSDNVVRNFDEVVRTGTLEATLLDGREAQAWGSAGGGGDATIQFNTRYTLMSPFPHIAGLRGIHETTHVSTNKKQYGYNDRALAQASYKAALKLKYKDVPAPPNTFDTIKNATYYSDRMFDACRPVWQRPK